MKIGGFTPQIFCNQPGDPMPSPTPAPAPAPAPAPGVPAPGRRGNCTCGFCDCELLADGAVLKTSDRARALQRAEETIAEQKATIGRLERELREARQNPQPPAGGKKGIRFLE